MIYRLLRCPQAAQLEFRQRTQHNASCFHRRAFSGEKGAGHPGVLVLAAATQACSEPCYLPKPMLFFLWAG